MPVFQPVLRLKAYGKVFIGHTTITVIVAAATLHCSAIPGSVIVLLFLLSLSSSSLLFWFNLEKHSPCPFLTNQSNLSLVKKEEMPFFGDKIMGTSLKKLRAEWNISDRFSPSHICFLTKWKRKKNCLSQEAASLCFLIFHMKGSYLSTGGSWKAGFLLSRYIHTFSPTTCSLIHCNYFSSQNMPGFWKQINHMLFKVKAKAKYRTNKRKVFTAHNTFPRKGV